MVLALIGLRILCKITNIHSFTEGNSIEEIMRKKIQRKINEEKFNIYKFKLSHFIIIYCINI